MARIPTLLISLLFSLSLSAQVIKLSANAKPLNQILIEMRDSYGIRFSFDDKELAQFPISVHQNFDSPKKALDYLLRPIAYTYLLNQGVFVIYHQPQVPQVVPISTTKREYQLSGTVFDLQTQEALPYTFIVVNKSTILCDEKGRFFFNSKTDSIFKLTFSSPTDLSS